jgi:hypothetical protein
MNKRGIASCVAAVALIQMIVTACTESNGAAASNGTSPPVEVAHEDCTKTFQAEPPPGAPQGTPTTIRYAEHAYPGRSKFELSGRVTNWIAIADSPSKSVRPTDFELEPQTVLYVKDGVVGAPCFGTATKTTFIYVP